MNEPIDPPLTAIPDAGGPTSPGPWPVNPMPSPANDAPSRPGYPLGAPVWTPGAPVWTPATPGAPGGFPVRPTDARTAWAVPGPNPATVSSLPTVLTPTSIAEPLTGVVPAGPPARRSRTADVALLLAAFVATAGVAFAIGRLSASESATAAPGLTGFPRLRGDGAQVEPGAALFAADAAGAAETSSSPAAAALPAVDGATADGATADRPAVAALSDTTDATTVGKGMAAGPPAGDLPVIGGDGQPPQGELPAGFDGGPPGAMPGAAFGGFIGTISAIEDGVLTLATQAGESRSIATDASTLYLRQASMQAADLSPGDRVRIASQRRRPSLIGADPDGATGPDIAAGEPQSAEGAAQVTVVPAGSPASQLPGVTEGTLVAVVEDGLVVQTDAGDTQVVSTSAGTAYARQEVIEAGLLKAGDRVSVQLPFGGPASLDATAADGSAAATDPIVAEQVTLLTDPES